MLEQEFQTAIHEIIGRINADANKAEEERAKADPKKYRLSRVFSASKDRHKTMMNYRYWYAGRDGRGRDVWYCWTVHRNVAGYFLGWRQVYSRKTKVTTRDQWVARKAKWRLRDLQQRRAERHKLKHQPVS